MTAVKWWCSGVVLNRIFGAPTAPPSPPRPPLSRALQRRGRGSPSEGEPPGAEFAASRRQRGPTGVRRAASGLVSPRPIAAARRSGAGPRQSWPAARHATPPGAPAGSAALPSPPADDSGPSCVRPARPIPNSRRRAVALWSRDHAVVVADHARPPTVPWASRRRCCGT